MTDPRVLKITQGFNGWTPKLSVDADGERRVLKLSGWTGGQGNPPQSDLYLGVNGYVTNIANAVDLVGGVIQDIQELVDIAEAAAETASLSAETATNQAALSTTNAIIATDQAALSTTNAIATAADRDQTGIDVIACETARDAAFTNANVYASNALGLAATTNGQQFIVVVGNDLVRYTNSAGTAVEVARTKASSAFYNLITSQGLVAQQPNLFSQDNVDFLSTSDRYIDAGIAQATIAANTYNNTPCWRITTAAATASGAIEWRFPVSRLSSYTSFSARISVLAADAGAVTGNREIKVILKQQTSSNTTISGVTQTQIISTGAAITSFLDLRFENVSIDGTAAYVLLQFAVQNQNGIVDRHIYVRDMMICAGINSDFRFPQTYATETEAVVGTSQRRTMTPFSTKAAIDAQTTPINASLSALATQDAAILEALMGYRYTTPLGFAWDNSAYPLYIYRGTGGVAKALIAPQTIVNSAIWTGAAFYVDTVSGSDSNNGLSEVTAVKGIDYAIGLGNATNAPYRIYIKAAQYRQGDSINGSVGTTEPTQHCAFIGYGGRVRHQATTNITWNLSKHSTYTNCSYVTLSSATDVYDTLNLTTITAGLTEYTRLTLVADVATCNSTANSYVISGGILYVNRADGAVASYNNTLVIRNIDVAKFLMCTKDLYFENIDFEGGAFGALYIEAVATRNIVTVNCSFCYAGALTNSNFFDGLRIRRTSGIVLNVNPVAHSNYKDGLNYHRDSGTGLMYVYQINPISYNNGRTGTSNNSFTTHDDVISICVNPRYYGTNNGADYHIIEETQGWVVGGGTTATVNGGSQPTAYKCSNTSKLWLEDTTANSSDLAIYAQESNVYTRNVTIASGTTLADGGGSIAPF